MKLSRNLPLVLIIQTYVPEYRFPLFERMHEYLQGVGLNLIVTSGRPQGEQIDREDAVSEAGWMSPMRQTIVRVGRREVSYKNATAKLQAHNPEVVILEHAIRNIETYQLLYAPAVRNARRIGFWGQGETYTEPANWLRDSLKTRLTLRADWFFSYTEGGARSLRNKGYPPERITILRNSSDTRQLREDLRSVSDREIYRFKQLHSLESQNCALFLGGLDSRKGLPFLLEAVSHAARLEPSFCLLIAGEGRLTSFVRQAEQEGAPVRHLGRLTGRDKAIAMRTAHILAIPEWVGLVAVDSLAAGLPIVTTSFERHAPEYEYLRHGVNAIVVQHDPHVYGEALVQLLHDASERKRLEAGCLKSAQGLSVEEMASRFVAGIEDWLRAPKRGSLSRP